MAQIPIGNFGQSVAAPQRGPRITGADAGLITAKAVGDLAATVANVANQQISEQARVEKEAALHAAQTAAVRTRVTKTNQLDEAAKQLSRDIQAGNVAKDKAEDEWNSRRASILDGATDGLDDEHKGIIQAELDGHAMRNAELVRNAVFIRNKEETRSNIIATRPEYATKAMTDWDGAVKEYETLIDKLGAAAGMGPDDVAKEKQSFRSDVAQAHATKLVGDSRDSIAGTRQARETLASNRFNDLGEQRRAALDTRLDAQETTLLQRQAFAEQRAANEAQAKLNRAQAAFAAAQARSDAGIPDSAEQTAITIQDLSGSPLLDSYKALQNQARQVGGFAAKPVNMQQKALDEVNAAIAQQGASEALVKRRDALQKVLDSSSRDVKEDPLRAGLQRGVIKDLPPIDTSSIDGLTRSVTSRLQAAGSVQVWAGRPVSPLTSDEAKQLADMLKILPVQQRSTAIATLANAIGQQASSGLAEQLQPVKENPSPQDRALFLAFSFAGEKTTAGRYTSEIILKGQQALTDKSIKPEKGTEFGWQQEIAKQVDGAYPNQKQADDAKQAAYLITAGMASEGSPDVARAVRLAAGGNIVEVNGRKIPVKPGVDEATVINRLRTATTQDFKAQAPDGKVKVGTTELPLDSFVAGLRSAQLLYSSKGRYNVLAGGRLVTNSAGQRISIEVNADAR